MVNEPKSSRRKVDNDPDSVTYVSFFNGLSSNAEINGTPLPVFTRQKSILSNFGTCMSSAKMNVDSSSNVTESHLLASIYRSNPGGLLFAS